MLYLPPMKTEKNIPLASHTTFKIGGPASYFLKVRSINELKDALAFAQKEKIPFFILGGGSNILVSDKGFPGLVIEMAMRGATYEKTTDGIRVIAWAGEGWDLLVEKTVEWNAWGIENLSAIPGTVGASPVQNIGAYGTEVMNVIESVTTIDSETGKEKIFSNKECGFTYRDSVFKKPEFKKYIITSVSFALSSKPQPNISYKDLQEYFGKKGNANPSQSEIRDAVIDIRSKKFPNLKEFGTAGSFWKNPIISKDTYEKIKKEYPLIPSFPFGEKIKIPLAWILDNVCNLKGYSLGKVGLFKNQPLVVFTEIGATKRDVDRLTEEVFDKVKEKIGLEIEREVEWVG